MCSKIVEILSDRLFFISVCSFLFWLTRWKKGEKEFDVKLSDDNSGSIICRVPKPIQERLGNPTHIKFMILFFPSLRSIPVASAGV